MKIDSTAVASMAFVATVISSSSSSFSLTRAFTAQSSITTSRRFAAARSLVAMASSASSSSETKTATATADTSNNPLLDISGLPKFASIEPKHLTPAVQSVLADFEADLESLEAAVAKTATAATYDDVLPQVERLSEKLGYVWGVAGHLNGVKNSDEFRAAYEENQPKVVELSSKVSQSKALYDALKSIEASWEKPAGSGDIIDTENSEDFVQLQKMRAVDLNLRSMTLGGVGLEGEDKKRFNEIKMRLAELSTKFSNNVLDGMYYMLCVQLKI